MPNNGRPNNGGAGNRGPRNGAAVETRRLFVSIDPSPAAVDDLGVAVETLEVSRANRPGHSTRLAARDRWHVTIAFLGDVPVTRVDDAVEAIRAGVARAAREPFILRFAGGGTFGRGRSAILWSGVDGDLESLRLLATAVRTELRRARLPYDRKPLKPHLTIARPGGRLAAELIAADAARLAEHVGPSWPVRAVHLVDSVMEQLPSGPVPRYTTLATVALQPPGR